MSTDITVPEVPHECLDSAAAALSRMCTEHYGCPADAPDVVVKGNKLTASFYSPPGSFERQLVQSGLDHLIEDLRHAFQEAMAPTFKAVVEEVTGHQVLSQTGTYVADGHRWSLVFVLGPES